MRYTPIITQTGMWSKSSASHNYNQIWGFAQNWFEGAASMAHHRRYVDTVIRMATQKMLSYQREDGAFSFCCEVNPLPDALVIIFLQMLNEVEDVLIPALCNRLLANQNPNGSWSSYPNQNGNISATSLAYFALLLSG